MTDDLIYLAKRQAVIEKAVIRLEDALIAYGKGMSEWQEFMSMQVFGQYCTIGKNKRQFEYFRSTLKETHKQNYEKFEGLFRKIDLLYDKKKKDVLL